MSRLSEQRRKCYDRLARESETLAHLYYSGTTVVDDTAFPGRVRIIAHCFREVGNRLPDFLGAPRYERWKPDDYLEAIADEWKRADLGLPSLEGAPPRAEAPDAAEVREIPISLPAAQAVQRAVDALGVRPTRRNAALEMFAARDPASGDGEALEPMVKEWTTVVGWFVAQAHEGYPARTLPDEKELLEYVERFEQIILALLSPFYETTNALDEILAEANS